MNSFQARQTIRMMICVSCLSAYQGVAIAQAPAKAAAGSWPTGWQSSARSRTIALPQVLPASGTKDSNQRVSTGTDFVPGPTSQLELGLPQTAMRNDPIPTSPWSVNNSVSTGTVPPSGTSKEVPGYQPRFIEQPSTDHRVPSQQAPSNDQRLKGYELQINNPLSQSNGTAGQFRTASGSQVVEQPFYTTSHQAVIPTVEPAVPIQENPIDAPALEQWNQLPLKGIQVNGYAEASEILANQVQAPASGAQNTPRHATNVLVSEVTNHAPEAATKKIAAEPTMSALDPYAAQIQEEQQRRDKIAAQVSKQLLATKSFGATPPKAIESPRGWMAIEEELRLRLKNCDDLLRRGATQSAREEVLIGLHSLCRAIDVRKGFSTSETSLQRALTAFEEEKDFYRDRSTGSLDVSMVAGHQTPVLQAKSTSNLSPIVASQHYRAYAKQQLIATSQGHPWAAELYYALGRTLESESEVNQEFGYMLREQAIACYQSALAIDGNHSDAANQLGYSLLRVDRPQEAEVALTAALSISPTAQAWKNLAEVYRRSGDANRSDHAVQQAMMLEGSAAKMANGQAMPPLMELSPEQFAQISPNTLQGVPNTQYLQQAPSAVQAPSGQAVPLTAASTEPAAPGRFEAIKRMFR